MLFSKKFKAAIRAGQVTRTYRSWQRPQAKPGGRYNLAPDGVITVSGLSRIALASVTDQDALAAGFTSQQALLDTLKQPASAEVYQVDFHYEGPGLVRQPIQDRLSDQDLELLREKLERMDGRSTSPWTDTALSLIDRQPATRAADLAPALGWDTPTFKRQIRKLKALGLTISLEVGYRLSARGEQLHDKSERSR